MNKQDLLSYIKAMKYPILVIGVCLFITSFISVYVVANNLYAMIYDSYSGDSIDTVSYMIEIARLAIDAVPLLVGCFFLYLFYILQFATQDSIKKIANCFRVLIYLLIAFFSVNILLSIPMIFFIRFLDV